jgi:hypothetical protein
MDFSCKVRRICYDGFGADGAQGIISHAALRLKADCLAEVRTPPKYGGVFISFPICGIFKKI